MIFSATGYLRSMNNNLIPETRVNKNGVAVIKHVRAEKKAAAGGKLPAPSLSNLFKGRGAQEGPASSEDGVKSAIELMRENRPYKTLAPEGESFKDNADLVRVFNEFPKRHKEIIETLGSAREVADIFTKPVPDEEADPTGYTNYTSRRLQSIARLRSYLSGEAKTF